MINSNRIVANINYTTSIDHHNTGAWIHEPSLSQALTALLISLAMDCMLYQMSLLLSHFMIMIVVGAIEFLCAQIPYSMKGTIVGLFYGSLIVFFGLNKGMTHIFKATSSFWSANTLFSCGFWYLRTNT